MMNQVSYCFLKFYNHNKELSNHAAAKKQVQTTPYLSFVISGCKLPGDINEVRYTCSALLFAKITNNLFHTNTNTN